ncbi:FAD-dependent oxidoreductase [Streptomyces sp. NPDC053474]|uniref:FAD-dependent oxidoreductase n=1 Tax=Streptomyces sp. NPDC053474 TaxID=3365704 RepID=UPI0037D83E31
MPHAGQHGHADPNGASAPDPGRRQLLRYGTAAAGALGVTALTGTRPSAAASRTTPAAPRRGGRVAVLGAGVGGLTAAHELAERGFDVTVYERKALGGKARSIPVPGTGTEGRADLPGEHGHRGVFGFYHNLPDTLRRIPHPGNAHGVHDNLTSVPWIALARAGGRPDLPIPTTPFEDRTLDVDALLRLVTGAVDQLFHLPAHEAAYFARRLAILMTSSPERSYGQWEHVKWLDFLAAEGKSEDYTKIFGGGAQVIQALKPRDASTRTCGQGLEAILFSLLQRGVDGPSDRIFNGPTSEVWIEPWARHLRSLGVRFAMGHTVEALELSGGRITAARAATADGPVRVEADWFVAAVPAERATRLWSPQIRAADRRLAAMDRLRTTWSQGIQYYLRRPVPVVQGHVAYIDSPWALVSISQSQFWRRDFARTWGDGEARDSFSVVISDWEKPGLVYGKPAKRCTRQQVADEVWAQLKAALEDTGRRYLPDDVRHSWFLDPAVTEPGGGAELANDEPYLLNDAGSWDHRPDAATAISNLFLAADYVRTYSNVDFTSMETANEAGRRAANALLKAAGSTADRVRLFTGHRPPEFEAAKRLDATRYRLGLPHILDTL